MPLYPIGGFNYQRISVTFTYGFITHVKAFRLVNLTVYPSKKVVHEKYDFNEIIFHSFVRFPFLYSTAYCHLCE